MSTEIGKGGGRCAWTESDSAAGNSCSLVHTRARAHARLVTIEKNSSLDILNEEQITELRKQ